MPAALRCSWAILRPRFRGAQGAWEGLRTEGERLQWSTVYILTQYMYIRLAEPCEAPVLAANPPGRRCAHVPHATSLASLGLRLWDQTDAGRPACINCRRRPLLFRASCCHAAESRGCRQPPVVTAALLRAGCVPRCPGVSRAASSHSTVTTRLNLTTRRIPANVRPGGQAPLRRPTHPAPTAHKRQAGWRAAHGRRARWQAAALTHWNSVHIPRSFRRLNACPWCSCRRRLCCRPRCRRRRQHQAPQQRQH